MSPSVDEEGLIEGFLLGDSASMRALDGWIQPVVRHQAWKLREHEEDLLQEIRLKLLRLFETRAFRGDSSLKTYVQAAAKYTCLDAVRRARVRGTETIVEEQDLRSRDDPEEGLERRDEARLCYLVLSRLPDVCRSMFQMVLDHELSYEQIAAEMRISLGTVKSRLARCRDRAVLVRRELIAARPGGIAHEE